MRHLTSLLLLALLAVGTDATAQITYLPSTGCQNAGQTPITGVPRIGTTLTVGSDQLPCNSPGTSGFVLLSLTCALVPPLSIGCFNNPCVLVDPQLIFTKAILISVPIPIPNDRTLIGFKFCVQGGCINTFPSSCFAPLNKVAQIQVTA